MAFPPSFLDELRARLTLSSVVGRHVRLVRKGRDHLGLCPFHNEKTPSFTVNDAKGFYHCFGCGAHGDVIAFAMNLQSLSFPEAVERLAAEAGLEVPAQLPGERERAQKAASLHEALEAAAVFFEKTLRRPVGRSGLDYLTRRGLDEATIARFRLGFAPDSRTALKQALTEAGIPEALSVEAGLLIRPDGPGDSYDRFRGRVTFPITDRRGRVVAFGGRILNDGQPKYLNSPETPLFHKGSMLYGLAQAREAAARAGSVIVAEGYMDVIALASAGFAHAVAPLGTALTETQIELLWTMAAEPVLCLDGDEAGRRAAERAALRALPHLKPGRSLRFALLPTPEDPDSLIRAKGARAMAEVVALAQPLHEMLWSHALSGHSIDTPERRAALEAALADLAGQIADSSVREQYQRLFKDRLWELMRGRRARPAFVPGRRSVPGRMNVRPRSIDRGMDGRLPGAGLPPRPRPAPAVQEGLLLWIVIRHPALLEEVAERLGSLLFADSELDKLRGEVLKQLGGWGSLDSEQALLYLKEHGFSWSLSSLVDGGALETKDAIDPDSSIEAARGLWEHVYKLYTEKDLSAELRHAEQRLGADLSEESLAYLTALWTLMNQEPDS
ncbi:MAG: DNA primase [Rhodospirillaceae bacterium]|nr:DNA primase [Rhodospirillaceae bacterium]